MKKLLKALTICLVGGTSLLTANNCCDTHTCCEFNGCWEAGLELLYWRPCVCDFDYAVIEYSDTNQDAVAKLVQRVRPTNHPGFRIFATYYTEECCRFITLDWLHVRSTDTARSLDPTTSGFLLVPFPTTQLSASDALAQIRGIYNKINLRVGQPIYNCGCFNVYTYAGARLIDLNTYRRVETDDQTAVWRQRAEYSAFGAELGIGGDYCFSCGLGLAGWFGGTAAVGQHKFHSDILAGISGTEGDQRTPNQTRCIPGLELRLGINYTKCCECWTATVEVGYEHHHYFGADIFIHPAGLAVLSSPTDVRSKTVCGDVGFGGPYVGLTLAY